jgi:hypothetical protein
LSLDGRRRTPGRLLLRPSPLRRNGCSRARTRCCYHGDTFTPGPKSAPGNTR